MSASLRQLHLVLRHGDRAPTFNASAGSPAEGLEAAAWAARVPAQQPCPTPGSCAAAPPGTHAVAGHHDTLPWPWGRLTRLGARQAHARGARAARRYAAFLARAPIPYATASNFGRTQQSLRHFLRGLAPAAGWPRAPPVAVPPPSECALAVFERPDGALHAVQRVVYATPAYAAEERRLQGVRDALEGGIPFFRGGGSGGGGGGGRFMWIRAADALLCYAAHGFTVPPRLRALEGPCYDHLLWRFLTFFSHGEPLRLAAGGLLQALGRELELASAAPGAGAEGAAPAGGGAAASPLGASRHSDITLHCGHDVTLLPVLMTLALALDAPARYGAAPLAAALAGGGSASLATSADALRALRWPGYAAMLAVELHHVGGGGHDDPPAVGGEWVVRWRLEDDEPLGGDAAPGVVEEGEGGAGGPCACAGSDGAGLGSCECAPRGEWSDLWGVGGGTQPDAAPPPPHAAAQPYPRLDAAVTLEGSLPLRGFQQLVRDVCDGALGLPMPGSRAV